MGLDMYLYASRTVDFSEVAELLPVADPNDTKVYDGTWWTNEGEDQVPGPVPGSYTYIGRWEHQAKRDGGVQKSIADAILDKVGLTPLVGMESNSVEIHINHDDTVRVQLMGAYWRKANAIHAWFVDECQDGVDECQVSPDIHPEKLLQLSSTCQAALNAYNDGELELARKTMEPRQGFFFGGYELDEYWAQDMARTSNEVTRLLNAAIEAARDGKGPVTFNYRSSW